MSTSLSTMFPFLILVLFPIGIYGKTRTIMDIMQFQWIHAELDNYIISINNSVLNETDGGDGLTEEENQLLENFLSGLYAYNKPASIILICLYIVLFPLAFMGNISILAVVISNRHLRHVTNFFLVNLAVADLLGKYTFLFMTFLPLRDCAKRRHASTSSLC
jgi:hypothetical protein